MRGWCLLLGLGFGAVAFAQDAPVEDPPVADEVDEAEAPPPPAQRPPPPPVEMTPERKAKAEHWEKRRIQEAATWHAGVRKGVDEWAATVNLKGDQLQELHGILSKMLETDSLIRAQMQGGEIKAKAGRERLIVNRGAAAESVGALLGQEKMEALRAHLTSVGGAY